MAVPKKKTSPSRRGMRRSHNALDKNLSHIIIDKSSGEYKRNHHIAEDGTYKGIVIIAPKIKKNKEEENAE